MHQVNSSHANAAASPAKRLVVLGFQDCHCGQRATSHGCEGKLVRRAMRVDLEHQHLEKPKKRVKDSCHCLPFRSPSTKPFASNLSGDCKKNWMTVWPCRKLNTTFEFHFSPNKFNMLWKNLEAAFHLRGPERNRRILRKKSSKKMRHAAQICGTVSYTFLPFRSTF